MFDSLFHLAYLGPGGPEFLVIMLVLLVMFGAKDAPRILRKLNEIINQIRNTADGFKREVMYGDLNPSSPDNETPDNTDESAHNEDYDYDSEENYYDYGEDDGGDGEMFEEAAEELKAEDLKEAADDAVSEEGEEDDAPKT